MTGPPKMRGAITSRKRVHKVKRQITLLRGLNFFYYATSALLTPLLPLYFAEEGYTKPQIGLLMMVGPFVAVFAQPLWGYLSDRFQTIKRIVGLLWGLTIASSVGLFNLHGFAATFAFVLLLFFFVLPSVPLLDSLTIKAALDSGVSYGAIRLWGSIGFSIFAVLSGLLLPLFGGVSHIGYMYWLFWLFPFALLLLLKDEPSPNRQPVTLRSMGALLKDGRFVWFLLLVFLVSVPHRMNDALYGLYLRDQGGSPWMISLAWGITAISEVPTFVLLSRFMHRYHELALLGIVSFLYALRWLLYAFIHDPWALVAAMALQSVTYAALWIVVIQYVTRIVPEGMRSSGQSLLSASIVGLAGITGGYFGGWVQAEYGGALTYLLGSALAAIAAALFLATHARLRKKQV